MAELKSDTMEQDRVNTPIRYKDYPAIKLARLAVDASLKRQGVGSQLVDFVIGLITGHVMPHTGCRFLVVDAKPESVNFYAAKGFVPIGVNTDGENATTAMFIDLKRVLAAVN